MITHKDRIVVLSFLASTNHTGLLPIGSIADDGSGGMVGRQGSGGIISNHSNPSFEDLTTPISPEFLNFAVALLVYSVRYPAVFWETNKAFGFLFSVQLMLSAIQSLLAFTGFSVFYKLHAYGAEAVLSTTTNDDFLLSRPWAVMLFVLSSAIVNGSGSVVYFYGLRKFQGCIVREHEKHHISWRENSRTLWGYLPHCFAFGVLVSVAVVTCPLLSDYTTVYKGSLDGSILWCVVGTIMFMFLWIVLWFTLTLKQHWHFRMHSGVSSICNGRAGKVSNDIELQRHRHTKNAPLLVISSGQTYTVRDAAPKKAIMGVLLKSIHHQRHHHQRCKTAISDDSDDDIYWLKPRPPPPSPQQSPEAERLLWSGRDESSKKKSSPTVKHKVTFEDTLLDGSPRRLRSTAASSSKSPKACNKPRKQCVKFEDLTDTDEDGDYATLRNIPLIREVDEEEHETSLEDLLKANDGDEQFDDDDEDCKDHNSQCDFSCDDQNSDKPGGGGAGHLQCLIAAAAAAAASKSPVHQINVAVMVHDESPSPQSSMCPDRLGLLQTTVAIHNDEDLAHEVATTRSNSLSSSCSPPEKGASSDTSSGIHSSSSICDNNHLTSRKSSSVDDLLPLVCATDPSKTNSVWKSLSLQRTPSNYSSCSSTSSAIPHVKLTPVAASPPVSSCGTSPQPADLTESTVVILRKQTNNLRGDDLAEKLADPPLFGRATNMRLTSFTDSTVNGGSPVGGGGGSPCRNSRPSTAALAKLRTGVVGCGTSPRSPLGGAQASTESPQSFGTNVIGLISLAGSGSTSGRKRDSANYSLTSSGDSDNYLSHS